MKNKYFITPCEQGGQKEAAEVCVSASILGICHSESPSLCCLHEDQGCNES